MSDAGRDCGRAEWPITSVAERAQMDQNRFRGKLTKSVPHFEYDAFALISGRKYDFGCWH
jgi:hypothetical protein